MTEIEWEEKLEEVQKHSEHWYGMYKKLENRIEELEAQIEKLGEQNIKDCENFNRVMAETNEQWNKEHYQLTKAKDIIRRLINACCSKGATGKATAEAEQFLKE